MNTKVGISCIALVLASRLLLPASAGAATRPPQIDSLESRAMGLLVWDARPDTDSLRREWVAQTLKDARQVADRQTADGCWPDLGVDLAAIPNWGTQAFVERAAGLALAGRLADSAESARFFASFAASMSCMEGVVKTGVQRQGNWFKWEIAIPQALAPALVLARGRMDSALWKRQVDLLTWLISSVPHMTGANLAWSSYDHLLVGILRGDTSRVRRAQVGLVQSLTAIDGDGPQDDGSYMQHAGILYNGGYGRSHIQQVARGGWILNGSRWAINETALSRIQFMVDSGFRWMQDGGYFDPATQGRAVVRKVGSDAGPLLETFRFLEATIPGVEGCYADEERDILLAQPQLAFQIGGYGIRTPGRPKCAAARGMRYFPIGEYLSWKDDRWSVGLRLTTAASKTGEILNGEGALPWHLGRGSLFLSYRDGGIMQGDVRAAMDWARIPGVAADPPEDFRAEQDYGFGGTVIAGAAIDTNNASIFLDAMQRSTGARGRRSWFRAGRILFVNYSGVRAPSGRTVVETIAQWPADWDTSSFWTEAGPVASNQELLDPLYLHHGRTGYLFPSGGRVNVATTTRSGAWSRFSNDDDTVHSRRFHDVWKDLSPDGADGSWVLVPDISRDSMAILAKTVSEGMRVLYRSSRGHVIQAAPGLVFGAFFEDVKLPWISTDGPIAFVARIDSAAKTARLNLWVPARGWLATLRWKSNDATWHDIAVAPGVARVVELGGGLILPAQPSTDGTVAAIRVGRKARYVLPTGKSQTVVLAVHDLAGHRTSSTWLECSAQDGRAICPEIVLPSGVSIVTIEWSGRRSSFRQISQ